MPELPDLTVYLEALERRAKGAALEGVRLGSPFLLRSVTPPLSALAGRRLVETQLIGKRLVLGFEGELFLVIHLMIAGRLRWRQHGAALPGRLGLAAFDFETGTLLLTEASKKRRASLHVVGSRAELQAFERGGLPVLSSTTEAFVERLRSRRHTLKRALTDPGLFSGIGNAYSDEILHRARLSPVRLTTALTDEEAARLHAATCATLTEWTERLRAEVGDGFPDKVTAFRPGMAVHGRFREPCPDCGAPVQRIAYAENETNYCAGCQTGGKLLADRSLSRLLKADWPKNLDELELRTHPETSSGRPR